MKVLAISASPRSGGNSDVLSDQFLKGAMEAGHSARKIRLAEKEIKPCRACYACSKTGRCVQRDDGDEVLAELIDADVITLATPVYFYSMDAQLKAMIDRTLPRYREISDKKIYIIVTAADPSHEAVQPAVDGIRGFIRCLPGAKEQEVLYGTGAWDKGDIYQHPVYEKAREAGRHIGE